MAYTKSEIAEMLTDFAGPLGPFETVDERFVRKSNWLATLSIDDAPELVALLSNPPTEKLPLSVDADGFRAEVADALIALGRRAPIPILSVLSPLLSPAPERGWAIDVIGGIGEPEGLPALASLDPKKLSEDELVRLACALGEIGNAGAVAQLRALQRTVAADMKSVHAEILIALQNSTGG